MKRRFICLFYCFFRLPIYESIAAIFWQSASCVLKNQRILQFKEFELYWGAVFFYDSKRSWLCFIAAKLSAERSYIAVLLVFFTSQRI